MAPLTWQSSWWDCCSFPSSTSSAENVTSTLTSDSGGTTPVAGCTLSGPLYVVLYPYPAVPPFPAADSASLLTGVMRKCAGAREGFRSVTDLETWPPRVSVPGIVTSRGTASSSRGVPRPSRPTCRGK